MIKNGASEQEVKNKMVEDADWRTPKEWELTEWYEQIKNPDEYVIEGYEGAVVLDPKPGIYLDDPIAVLDYASLYPSSMISENLSPDSKVWTIEYDMKGNVKEKWGEKDGVYDNLPGYKYVDVTYDTYKYVCL